jgi:hypothetical protein
VPHPKKNQMKDWERLVEQAVTNPEFLEAWQSVEHMGIGSAYAVHKITGLITNSEFHRERLINESSRLVERLKELAEELPPSEPAENVSCVFHEEVLRSLRLIAAVYMTIGAMTGIGSIGILHKETFAHDHPAPWVM